MTLHHRLLSALVRSALAAAMLSAVVARTTVAQSLLGRWQGSSTCVKAEWNSSCNNEQIVYEFAPLAPNLNHVLLHASKVVQGQIEPMGDDLPLSSATGKSWTGEFSNARVHIRWIYELRGDTLYGQLVSLPSLRVARNVVAWREPTIR